MLLERDTRTASAAFERLIVHEVLEPTVSCVAPQVGVSNSGVDHRVSVTDWVELPKLAVMVAVSSAGIILILALNAFAVLPAGTTRSAGTVTSAEVELMFTTVSA